MPIDSQILQKELGRLPWQRWLYGRPVSKDAVRHDQGDKAYGFVETGPETIEEVINYLFDRRNVMLVGPRGTGKSYMARKAVEAIDDDPELGNVAVITLQGDPNKPPSDYFDDGILFTIQNTGTRARVAPSTVKAPFFSRAADRSAGDVKFKTDQDGRLQLFKNDRLVDRVVIFWDEGNRSSPAMQNAMLSLLADGVIRRDGFDYQFPPVSCIMTRNPDGYDAQSAKLPSPLVDRFGVQLYVYNPDLNTLLNKVLPTWHADYLRDMKIELQAALVALKLENPPKGIKPLTKSLEANLNEEREWRKARNNPDPRPAASRLDADDFVKARAAIQTLNERVDVDLCKHAKMVLERLALMPEIGDEGFKLAARRLGLIILSTWGDKRTRAEKPGMQYLSEEMVNKLEEIGRSDAEVRHAQRTLGQLTRYGTSIRAYVDLLDTLCGDSIRAVQKLIPQLNGEAGNGGAELEVLASARGLTPAPTNMSRLRTTIGRLLNHRCEAAFNSDREADKAREKTKAMVLIAHRILNLNSDELVRLHG